MRLYRILIAAGYISIFLLVLLAAYIFITNSIHWNCLNKE